MCIRDRQYRAGRRAAQLAQPAADEGKEHGAAKACVDDHGERTEQIARQLDRRCVVEKQRGKEHPINQPVVEIPKFDAGNALSLIHI